MKVVAFTDPPQTGVIEKILRHHGLWQASAPRAPPDVDNLVLKLDAAYSDSSIDFPDQADQLQELTYIDIYYFLTCVGRKSKSIATQLVALLLRTLPLPRRLLMIIGDSPTKR